MSETPLFLRALAGENTSRAPMWFMRQAGRSLPEYRKLKEKHSFWEMARTPELACEVTLQPVRRWGVDAAILFQDIMTPLPPMGVGIEFKPGPVIEEPIRTAAQVDALRLPDMREEVGFVYDAIRAIRAESTVPLIGFAGAPLTLATYLVQGSGSKDYAAFRGFLRAEPALMHRLLEKLTIATIEYVQMQIDAGAQAIQIFDSWAGLHGRDTWAEFSMPYAQRVFDAIEETGVPRIFLAVGSGHLYGFFPEMRCEGFSVDWRTPLDEVRPFVGNHRALQGNLDPSVLLSHRDVVSREVKEVLRRGLGGPHIFNLGHGMMPGADLDLIAWCIEEVRSFDRSAHE